MGDVRGKTQEGAALPVWANLFFVDRQGLTVWNDSVHLHGLPPLGALVEADGHFGEVIRIRYASVVDGSLKPLIVVEVTGG